MTAASAVLGGSMVIPTGALGAASLSSITQELTVSVAPMGEEPYDLELYRISDGLVHLPRQYGIAYCTRQGIEYTDETSAGFEISFNAVPQPRDYQVAALDELQDLFNDYYDYVFRARTGWGKTIGSLILASRLARTTLVIVDQDNLKDGWVKTLKEKFGCTDDTIGIVQGDKCRYEGCPVTIAMAQTLRQREFSPEFYRYFGTLIVDECHVIGAPTFWPVLLDFPAMYRIGVSATPRRRDALQKAIDHNLGQVRLYISDEHDESAVYVAEHPTVYSQYANESPKIGRFVNEVTGDGSRNLLLAETIGYLYDTGRDILVLSDRIEQLTHLMNLCHYLGIPEEEMGVYAGYRLVYGWEKNPRPWRRPRGSQKDVEYTPVHLNLISKRAKKPDLERIKTKCRVIFATYGKFSKGVDEPRLSGGVDASPRSQSEQVQGRILRKVDGKLKPIWVTVADTRSYRSLFGLIARLVDYTRNNAVVSRWSLTGGKTPCDVKTLRSELQDAVADLKAMRIVKDTDGLNLLMSKAGLERMAAQRTIARVSPPPTKAIKVPRAPTVTKAPTPARTVQVARRRGSPTGC